MAFRNFGLFEQVAGIIIGKPQDEVFYQEYKSVFKTVVDNPNLPILYNVNFGHAYPRTIIPYGIEAKVDLDNQYLRILDPMFI